MYKTTNVYISKKKAVKHLYRENDDDYLEWVTRNNSTSRNLCEVTQGSVFALRFLSGVC